MEDKLIFYVLFLNLMKFCEPSTYTYTTSTISPWLHKDNMGKQDKMKIQKLALELIVDTKLKLRQVIGVAYDHTKYDGYHYGYIIGKIRQEYSSMLEIYKTALNRLPGFNYSLILPPATRVVRPIHYIHYMHDVNMLERDIEQMVQVMEWIRTGAAALMPSPYPLPGFVPPLLRTKVEVAKEKKEIAINKQLRMDEGRLKSKIREGHLMRKIGLPANTSTTKKRFLNRWPVEDTWRLNGYESV